MRALLWKDVRLNGSALILGGVMLLLPYGGGLVGGTITSWRGGTSWWNYDAANWIGGIAMLLSLLTMAILAGNAMAAEREDRSSEFLACLPPSRWMVVASKAAVTGVVAIFLFSVNLAVILVVAPRLPGAPAAFVSEVQDVPATEALWIGSTAVLLVGVAWFVSSWENRASTALAAALFSPAVVGGGIVGFARLMRIPSPPYGDWFVITCMALGILGFVSGTIHFVRRFEP